MNYFIGCDAHSKSSTFVVVDQNGKETHRCQIPTTEFALLRFVRSIPSPKSLTFEECHLSQWLYTLLKREVDHLIVCNPRYVPRRQGSKNDPQDATHLAQLLRGGFLTPVFHQQSELMELRPLMNAYLDVVTEFGQARNRFKALFLKQAIRLEGVRAYRNVSVIEQLHLSQDQFTARHLRDQILTLETIHKSYLKYFDQLAERIPEIQVLRSIPGIATVRAAYLAAAITHAQRFKNKHHFWAYCELIKLKEISDGVTYRKKGRRANRILKAIFIGAAKSAMQSDEHFKSYYEHLRKNGMNYKVARRTLARLIASIALAAIRNKKEFQGQVILQKIKTLSQQEKNQGSSVLNHDLRSSV